MNLSAKDRGKILVKKRKTRKTNGCVDGGVEGGEKGGHGGEVASLNCEKVDFTWELNEGWGGAVWRGNQSYG